MATVKRRRPGSNGTAPELQSHADSTANGSAGPGTEQNGHPFEFECPCCGKVNTARIGREGAWLAKCYRCELDAMADALGCAVWELLDDAPRWLEPYAAGRSRRSREVEPAPLPSEQQISEWRDALTARHRAWLWRERGFNGATIARAELGWDAVRGGFTYPIRDASGTLVNVSWRAPRGRKLSPPGWGPKARLRGRTAARGELPLYPMPLPARGGLLVEGEPDALLARQHGLPAFTGLLGKQWNAAWDEYAAGREVAVAYDVGAEDAAAGTVAKLRDAGARRAWMVALGLPRDGDDIGDWFVTYRRTADDLRRLIRKSRPRRVARR